MKINPLLLALVLSVAPMEAQVIHRNTRGLTSTTTKAKRKLKGSGGGGGPTPVPAPVPAQTTEDQSGENAGFFVGTNNCMNDNWHNVANKNSNLQCTANDVVLQSVTASIDGSCVPGETVKLTLNAEVYFRTARNDVGWYIPLDGGNGLTGDCAVSTLDQARADAGLFSTTGDATLTWTDNVCGDVGPGATTLTVNNFLYETDILCQDTNSDGTLDLDVCFSWKSSGTSSDTCDPHGITPGSPAKCDCIKTEVPNIQTGDPPDGCVQDNAPNLDLVCTSDDVSLNSISAAEDATCIAGQTTVVTLQGSITFANSVTDPFWYIATDAGDALVGSCTTSYLADGLTYDFTNDATVSFDDNVCGDVVVTDEGSTTLESVQLVKDQAIQCVDSGDGKVEVSVCFSWNDGSPAACGVPGSNTACACATYEIPNLTVGQPPITVLFLGGIIMAGNFRFLDI